MQYAKQRWLIGGVALTGGLLWIVGGLSIWSPSLINKNSGPVLAFITELSRLAVVPAAGCFALALHALRQRSAVMVNGQCSAGFVLSFAALIVVAAAVIANQLVGYSDEYQQVIGGGFGFGIICLSAGLIIIGSTFMQNAKRSGWQALPLILGLLGLFLPIGAGIQGLPGFVVWVLFGLGWCWLGGIMVLEQTTKTESAMLAVVGR